MRQQVYIQAYDAGWVTEWQRHIDRLTTGDHVSDAIDRFELAWLELDTRELYR